MRVCVCSLTEECAWIPSTLPAFSEWFICSLSCTEASTGASIANIFFSQHLQRWRWQVFIGAAAAPARWNPSNCCLPLLFCAEGLWRQHLLYKSWGWVLCCPAWYASTLLSVHPGCCPVACLCYPRCYRGNVSFVQHWVSERWLSKHSFCFVRYFATFLDSLVNAAHSNSYQFCWLP